MNYLEKRLAQPNFNEISTPDDFDRVKLKVVIPSDLTQKDLTFCDTLAEIAAISHERKYIGFHVEFSRADFNKIKDELAQRPDWVQYIAFEKGKVFPYKTVGTYSFLN